MLSTNLRSPDSYLCTANELLASLIISSKNKSHCLNSRSQRQSRAAAVQVLSVIKIHSPPLDCPHLSHRHSKYLKGHQSAIDLIATWKMICVHPALGWQVPNDSHCHRHLWAPHRHSHGAAWPQGGHFPPQPGSAPDKRSGCWSRISTALLYSCLPSLTDVPTPSALQIMYFSWQIYNMPGNILTSLLQSVGYYIKSQLEWGRSGKQSTQVMCQLFEKKGLQSCWNSVEKFRESLVIWCSHTSRIWVHVWKHLPLFLVIS